MWNAFLHSFAISGISALALSHLGAAQPATFKSPGSPSEAKEVQEKWAAALDQDIATRNDLGMAMILIPPGEFTMGSEGRELEMARQSPAKYWAEEAASKIIAPEQPARRVAITKPFRISATEVTIGQFRKFVEATDYVTESIRDGRGGDARGEGEGKDFRWDQPYGPGESVTENYPVTQITWNDAVAFCEWLSKETGNTYRLPTEAEWEYAARAGSQDLWFFGDDPERLDEYGVVLQTNPRRHTETGTKQPNAFGLYDTIGNVWEWTSDRGAPFEEVEGTITDPAGAEQGERRVRKGGNYSVDALQLRSSFRKWSPANYRGTHVGFRVVEEL